MRLLATIWILFISFLELLFVFMHPRLWRFYIFFQFEYFFFSPYHYADKGAQDDYVFGYTPLFSFNSIFKKARKYFYQQSDYPLAFCDAGCGDGRGLFLVSILHRRPVCGMEMNKRFVDRMMFMKTLVNKRDIMVVGDDMFNSEFDGYGIIFITWTTFKNDTEKRLIQKLEKEVMKGAIIVTLSYPIESESFEQLATKNILTSWGKSTAFFQRKIK